MLKYKTLPVEVRTNNALESLNAKIKKHILNHIYLGENILKYY